MRFFLSPSQPGSVVVGGWGGGGGGRSPSLAVLCLACCWPLAQYPWHLLPWSHHHGVWRSCRLFPFVLSLLDMTCFFLRISGEVRLSVTVLSVGCIVGRRLHPMEQASVSHTLCYCPKHNSAISLLVLSPYSQIILAFSKAWLGYNVIQNAYCSTWKKCNRKRLIDFITQFFLRI